MRQSGLLKCGAQICIKSSIMGGGGGVVAGENNQSHKKKRGMKVGVRLR